jgi:Uri superfamily endonuclease
MMPLRDPNAALIPKSKGTYALILWLDHGQRIQIGKLGAFEFPAGYYLYTGSAFGPGGLAGRLGRHIALNQASASCHWHIDYLHCRAPIVAIWFSRHQTPREHDWAALVGQLAGCSCPAPRFGASDCRCHAHLFHFAQPPAAGRFSALLAHALPGDGPLQIIQIDGDLVENR